MNNAKCRYDPQVRNYDTDRVASCVHSTSVHWFGGWGGGFFLHFEQNPVDDVDDPVCRQNVGLDDFGSDAIPLQQNICSNVNKWLNQNLGCLIDCLIDV